MTSPQMLALVLFGVQSTPAFGQAQLNVYGKPMTDCGQNHASGCTYVSFDAGAHEVCVTQLPQGFSTVTGQGPWSDEFTGQPWCVCIWAYSNYILQNKDLALKCESIPAKVLEEQYSLDKFAQCGSMSSTAGCGAEDIRRSIQSLCQQCDAQTGDQTSKVALKAKCDKILAAAPAAPMSRLFDQSGSLVKGVSQKHSTDAVPSFVPAIALAGLAVAGVLMAVLGLAARNQRNRGTQGLLDSENPVSSAEVAE